MGRRVWLATPTITAVLTACSGVGPLPPGQGGEPTQTSGGAPVASIEAPGGRTITLEGPPGTSFARVARVEPPAGLPDGVSLPVGLLAFELEGVEPGAAVQVRLVLPADVSVGAYYKHGSSAAAAAPSWYSFGFDGTTGALFTDGAILLRYVDGGRGDGDGLADGRIVDPGGPAWDGNQPPSPAFTITHASDHPWAVIVDGSGSVDHDGWIETLEWHWGDGGTEQHICSSPTTCQREAAHAYRYDGPFDVGLLVTDDDGATSWVEAPIAVPPTPFGCTLRMESGTKGPAPHRADFRVQTTWEGEDTPLGRVSFRYPDNLVIRLDLDTGDGTTSFQRPPRYFEPEWNHIYRQPGTYVLSVGIDVVNPATNEVGASAICEQLIEVCPPAGCEAEGAIVYKSFSDVIHVGGGTVIDDITLILNPRMSAGEDGELTNAGSTFDYRWEQVGTDIDGCVTRNLTTGSGEFSDKPGESEIVGYVDREAGEVFFNFAFPTVTVTDSSCRGQDRTEQILEGGSCTGLISEDGLSVEFNEVDESREEFDGAHWIHISSCSGALRFTNGGGVEPALP